MAQHEQWAHGSGFRPRTFGVKSFGDRILESEEKEGASPFQK
jgi:hypothetical protein